MYYDIIKNILLGFITSFIYIYIWISLIDKKEYNKNTKIYILYLILSVILFYLLELNLFLSNLLLVIVLVPILRILFNENINICLITLLLSQILNIMSSLLFKIIFNLFIKDLNIFDIYSIKLINLYVLFLFTFIITKSKYFKKIVKIIYNKINIGKTIFIIILTGSILFLYNYTSTFLQYKFSFRLLILLNIFIIIIYIKMIYKFAFIKKQYSEVSDRYINIIHSLKEYEDMIDKYRILNHENKNQLLTIRAMILKSEDNIPKYIDTIIDTTIKDNEKLMFETNVIPSGGLRAIIYSKMLYMKDNNIDVKLDVERTLRRINLDNLKESDILDMCKIVGVFLDNAIEEVKSIENKIIKIKLYISLDDLCILISNKYNNKIDISKIDEVGYTTKEKGHGYGLCLVKSIIDSKENRFENIRCIKDNYFTQILKIKNIK